MLEGNPPDNPKAREVEFSKKEFLHEEVKIYRQPDHGHAHTHGLSQSHTQRCTGSGQWFNAKTRA